MDPLLLLAQAPTVLDSTLSVTWPVLLVIGGVIVAGAEVRLRVHQQAKDIERLDARLTAIEKEHNAAAVQMAGMSAMFGEIRASLAELREDLRALRDRE